MCVIYVNTDDGFKEIDVETLSRKLGINSEVAKMSEYEIALGKAAYLYSKYKTAAYWGEREERDLKKAKFEGYCLAISHIFNKKFGKVRLDAKKVVPLSTNEEPEDL